MPPWLDKMSRYAGAWPSVYARHQIASSCGQLLTLEHDEQHPRRIGAIHRRIGTEQCLLVRYGYDSDGRLTQVRNSADDVLRAFTL